MSIIWEKTMSNQYLTQITVPPEAMEMLRGQAKKYGLGLAGVVRVLLINALDEGISLPQEIAPNEQEYRAFQIGIPFSLVERIGGSEDIERAKELTRIACKYVINLATEKHQITPSSACLYLSLSSSAA